MGNGKAKSYLYFPHKDNYESHTANFLLIEDLWLPTPIGSILQIIKLIKFIQVLPLAILVHLGKEALEKFWNQVER